MVGLGEAKNTGKKEKGGEITSLPPTTAGNNGGWAFVLADKMGSYSHNSDSAAAWQNFFFCCCCCC